MSELINRFRAEYQRTKKSLGQHFLTNSHFIEEIADAAELSGSSPVIEIGPGSGMLTEALAKRTNFITAIELDDTAAEFLHNNKSEFFPHLEIIHSDVTKVALNEIYEKPVTVVGNLPYNLSVKIVGHCTNYIDSIRLMVFMFQKEVAQRIAAQPGNKDYSSLSVFCGYHYEIKKIRDIGGGNFWPNANVMSTVLTFAPKTSRKLQGEEEQRFLSFIYSAFRQKRKTLKNNLKNIQKLDDALNHLNISQSVRAEQLSIDEFIEVFRYVQP